MKYLITLLLLFLLPCQSLAYSLADAQKDIDTRSEEFQQQLVSMRSEGVSNNTQDLVHVGIHNLRILSRSFSHYCAQITEGANSRTRQEEINFCHSHAENLYQLNRTLFQTSMQQDASLKRTDFYEQRLVSFNEHLREILELFIFIRGTITKVQKSIDGTAAKTFTR